MLLTYEIIEELIEEAIAYTITTVIAKTLSFLLVVVLTQTVKVTAKGLAKGITVVLKPAVKRLTYKEGNDKINKPLHSSEFDVDERCICRGAAVLAQSALDYLNGESILK